MYMLNIIYKLNSNLQSRSAAQLVFKLNDLSTAVFLQKKDEERRINGKSLIGVLSGKFLEGDIIKIIIDNPSKVNEIKQIFNDYGVENV